MNTRVPACILCSLLPFVFLACADGDDNLGTGLSGNTSSSSSGAGGGIGGAGGAEMIPEPDGPSKLTVVNGVNDYDAIRLCFLPWPDGGDPPAFPDDTAGLEFAKAAVIDTASGFVPEGTDVYVHVIAGNLGKTAGQTCAALTGGNVDPEVLVVPLAVIPLSALEAPRSLLLVPNGCLGGAGHEDNLQQAVCGMTYSIDTPTPGIVAAGMSRIVDPNVISLQVAHGVMALPKVDIMVLSGMEGATPAQVAPSLTLGAIAPIPPFRQYSRTSLGSLSAVQIQTYPPGFGMASSVSSFQTALDRGGLAAGDVEDGNGFTMVAVGSPPGLPGGPFWHPLTWVVVKSDP